EGSLVHPLSRLGRRCILRAECPKNGSGCAVNHLQTLGQEAGISVIKLAVRKRGLALKSQGFTDHESGGSIQTALRLVRFTKKSRNAYSRTASSAMAFTR